MDLFIQVRDGQPYEHPIFSDNFREAFPHIDVNNLPPEFARFVRVTAPEPGVYEVYEGRSYQRDGDVFTDVHQVRPMTAEEKAAKQQAVKDEWAAIANTPSSWTFSEDLCRYVAPIPYPNDGQTYSWNEANLAWEVLVPATEAVIV